MKIVQKEVKNSIWQDTIVNDAIDDAKRFTLEQ